MKVLVTGGAGFIGSHLVEALVARGDEVTVIDDLSTGLEKNLQGVHGKLKLIAPVRVSSLLGGDYAGQDVVYHLAAETDVAKSVEDPQGTMRRNPDWTQNVLEMVRSHRVPRCVFASSCAAEYNANPYGASKRCGEVLCEMYRKAFGIETVSLRFQNVYGPRQRADLPNPPAVAAFVRAACRREPLVIHGSGKQRRDFIYVDDVVKALIAAGTKQPCPADNIVDVRSGSVVSIAELAVRVGGAVGHPHESRSGPERPGDVDVEAESAYPMIATLGVDAETGLDEGIRKTIEWYRSEHGD